MAIQQRKKSEGLGKIRICSPLDTRANTQAVVGILRTDGILAKAGHIKAPLPLDYVYDFTLVQHRGFRSVGKSSLRRAMAVVYNRQMDAIMQVLGPLLEWMFFIGLDGPPLVGVIGLVVTSYTILENDLSLTL